MPNLESGCGVSLVGMYSVTKILRRDDWLMRFCAPGVWGDWIYVDPRVYPRMAKTAEKSLLQLPFYILENWLDEKLCHDLAISDVCLVPFRSPKIYLWKVLSSAAVTRGYLLD